MKNILVIKSSASGAASVSNKLVYRTIARLRAEHPQVAVIERDLDREPVPHVRSETLAGIGRQAPETDEARVTDVLSKALIAEVHAADAIVIGAPMYNFGVPSTLKAWFDHVLRAGATFNYTANGPQGLVAPKPVVVIESRAGTYSEGPMSSWDAQEPNLRAMLALMGLTEPTFVRVEGLAAGPEAAAAAVEKATATIDALEFRALEPA